MSAAARGRSVATVAGIAVVLVVGLVVVLFARQMLVARATADQVGRLDRLSVQLGADTSAPRSWPPVCDADPVVFTLPAMAPRAGATLATWQSVAGCGAGASSGTGAGIKWIGRNVSGGLFRVECQANYIDTVYGWNSVGTALVSADVSERWNLGLSVPYLYKFMRDPYGLGFDVRNRGLGDINALFTRRFGAIKQLSATLSLGAPSGSHDATLVRDKQVLLEQDRQLGLGKPTASLTLDHTVDHGWGPTVLGGIASWRGGTNDLGSHRAPSATLYGYASYLLGPFAPAIGAQATGFSGHDRDRGQEQTSPLYTVAATASLEWSTDWLAILVGASLPYQYDALKTDANGRPRNPWGFGPWVVALGFAFAP